jgi:hypothetical protein
MNPNQAKEQAMTVRVSTTQFEFSHGCKPRGDGNWGFKVGSEEVWVLGLFSDAARVAKRAAREMGVREVEVLS